MFGERIKMLEVDFDRFSDDQMSSKIWLCHEIESAWSHLPPLTVWILGSCYGLTALALILRQKLPIREMHLFNLDPEAQSAAQKILTSAEIEKPEVYFHPWKGRLLRAEKTFSQNRSPGLLINTSCECFKSMDWLHRVPQGSFLALQSNHRYQPEIVSSSAALDDLIKQFHIYMDIEKAAQMNFLTRPSPIERLMLLGRKREAAGAGF
jgi:hypothetical protein